MEPTPTKLPTRFYGIDLLRFVAALSVVLYHYTYRDYAANNFSPIPFLELGRVTRYGYLGVELFFLISGYVVLLSTQGKTVRQFFLSRITRLYPAFWVACTLTFLVERLWGKGPIDHQMPDALHAQVKDYAYNMTMLYGFLNTAHIDDVYWSLTIEIIFYLLVSLLLAYKLLAHIDLVLTVWVAYTALAGMGVAASGTLLSTLLFPDYAPYFIAGMLFFLLQQSQGQSWRRYTLLAAAYLLAVRAAVLQAGDLAAFFHSPVSGTVAAGLVSLFFLIFYLITLRKINLQRFACLASAGALTYPLYLLHNNIACVAFHRLGHLLNKYVLLGGTLVVMLLASYLIHAWVEKPLRSWLGTQAANWLLPLGQQA